jgi:xanthine dehydrogenase accessory factor
MHGYWEKFQKLVNSQTPFVSVTLVDVVASAPANVGSKMLVTAEGLFHGTVGGGKVEMKAIAEARQMLEDPVNAESSRSSGNATAGSGTDAGGGGGGGTVSTRGSRFVEWNLQRDIGMTCGGGVRLFFEMYNVATWPIVIFGAGHCAQALARLLLTLPCQVTLIDAREEWLAKLPQDPKLRIIHAERSLSEYVKGLPRRAFVVLMTMGHATDQPILIEILKTREFPYLGVIGSEAKAAALRRGLLAAGLSEDDFGRYFCPIGLSVGTNDPAEIAISIAAQLLERRDAVMSTLGAR